MGWAWVMTGQSGASPPKPAPSTFSHTSNMTTMMPRGALLHPHESWPHIKCECTTLLSMMESAPFCPMELPQSDCWLLTFAFSLLTRRRGHASMLPPADRKNTSVKKLALHSSKHNCLLTPERVPPTLSGCHPRVHPMLSLASATQQNKRRADCVSFTLFAVSLLLSSKRSTVPNMQHTYLRYECADAFGLTTSSGATSKAPQSNSSLKFIGRDHVVTLAGSQCILWNTKQSLPVLKIGHRELLSGGVGTGRALNSNEVVCIDISSSNENFKVATGWIDGTVRIFDVSSSDVQTKSGLVHSLLHGDEEDNDEFVTREPLLLSGHKNTPVRSISFDRASESRLASGASDGSVVVWDVVAETGLFRLLGHSGAITNVCFVNLPELDGLITSSLDGLVKIWDLSGQCCIQTIPNHNGQVWGATTCFLEEDRMRLMTASTDGQVRVWSVQAPKERNKLKESENEMEVEDEMKENSALAVTESSSGTDTPLSNKPNKSDNDNVCHYMGSLLPPPSMTSREKCVAVHFSKNNKYVGVLHANSKTIDVYIVRSAQEAMRKQKRRLRRRREKQNLKINTLVDKNKRKRGILDDDDDSSKEEQQQDDQQQQDNVQMDPELLKASDEFEYYGTVRASHKIRGFSFVPTSKKLQVACVLGTNAVEVHMLVKKKQELKGTDKVAQPPVVVSEKVSSMDMYGHATGIRSIALSSDDVLACTVSKNNTKIWNVANRSCLLSVNHSSTKTASSSYGLCATFLPGNTHVVLGTREGRLLILDTHSGDIVYTMEGAHEGAIWSMDLRRATPQQETITLVTGSADKTVKFWDIEAQQQTDNNQGHPMVVHTRTLQMSDDVVAVRYSHSTDPSKRMVFVSTLDCTVKVFFDDTLKFFLSLYGHKLPALAVDASDDDVLLASSGADKTIKIWGLDFGDTHRTLYGHDDSITDLQFVRKTHNFFTTSKDGTVRYWDGDRFEQVLLLMGHAAEVNCLAVSRTGAFVLSGGMDRQVRVWERTKDIVFLEEERERELEQMFDKVDGMGDDGAGTSSLMRRRKQNEENDDDDDDEDGEEQPQSEAAVQRSVLSVSSGDRIMEALERADQELKEAAAFRKSLTNKGKERSPNPFLLGLEPAQYILWVLRSVKSADLEQSLLILPLNHMERLVYYLIVLLRSGRGTEICSRVAVFMIKVHQNQIVSSGTMSTPLRELRRLVRLRLEESRDTVGFNLAALRAIAKVAQDRKNAFFVPDESSGVDVWAGLGLGSDVAAALEGKKR